MVSPSSVMLCGAAALLLAVSPTQPRDLLLSSMGVATEPPPPEKSAFAPKPNAHTATPKLVKEAKLAMRNTVADLKKAQHLGMEDVNETLKTQEKVLNTLRQRFPPKNKGPTVPRAKNETEVNANLARLSDTQKEEMGKLAMSFAEASAKTALQKLRNVKETAPEKIANKVEGAKIQQGDLFRSLKEMGPTLATTAVPASSAPDAPKTQVAMIAKVAMDVLDARSAPLARLEAQQRALQAAEHARIEAELAKTKVAAGTQAVALDEKAEAQALKEKEAADAEAQRAEEQRSQAEEETRRALEEAALATEQAAVARREADEAKAEAEQAEQASSRADEAARRAAIAARSVASKRAASMLSGSTLGHQGRGPAKRINHALIGNAVNLRAATKPTHGHSARAVSMVQTGRSATETQKHVPTASAGTAPQLALEALRSLQSSSAQAAQKKPSHTAHMSHGKRRRIRSRSSSSASASAAASASASAAASASASAAVAAAAAA